MVELSKEHRKQLDKIMDGLDNSDAFIVACGTRNEKGDMTVNSAMIGDLADLHMITHSNMDRLKKSLFEMLGDGKMDEIKSKLDALIKEKKDEVVEGYR